MSGEPIASPNLPAFISTELARTELHTQADEGDIAVPWQWELVPIHSFYSFCRSFDCFTDTYIHEERFDVEGDKLFAPQWKSLTELRATERGALPVGRGSRGILPCARIAGVRAFPPEGGVVFPSPNL